MNFFGVATVKFTMMRSCYITVPKNWSTLGEAPVHLLLKDSTKHCEHYVTWAGGYSVELDTVELNEIFAEKLQLTDQSMVTIERICSTIPDCSKAVFSAVSEVDWEIMQLNCSSIEQSMMNQIKIITKGMVFPLWANNCNRFYVLVESVVPDNKSAVLTDGTEIAVSPHQSQKAANLTNKPKSMSPTNKLKSVTNNEPETGTSNEQKKRGSLTHKPSSKSSNVVAQPYDHNKDSGVSTILNTFLKNLTYLSNAVISPTENIITSKNINLYECLLDPFEMAFRVGSTKDLFGHQSDASPTDVYISELSLISHFCEPNLIPKTFLVVISKALSPVERSKKQAIDAPQKLSSKSSIKSSDSNSLAQDRKISPSTEAPSDSITFDSSVVRVNVISMQRSCDHLDVMQMPSTGSIYLSDSLRKQIGLDISGVVCLKSLHHVPQRVGTVEIQPVRSLNINLALKETILKSFSIWLQSFDDGNPVVMSLGTLFHLTDYDRDFAFDFVIGSFIPSDSNLSDPKKDKYFYLSSAVLKNITVNVGAKISPIFKPWDIHLPCKSLSEIDHEPIGAKLETLGGIREISETLGNALEFSLSLTELALVLSISPSGKNYLLHGSKGVGKTVVARSICQSFWDSRFRVFTKVVDCKQLRGKRVDTVKKLWEEACCEAVHRKPSIILFDDLDAVASAITRPEQESSPDSIYFNKMAEAFVSVMRMLESLHVKVSVVATSKSMKSLHPLLTHSSGKHVFLTSFKLFPPNLSQREEILKALILKKSHLSPETLNNVPFGKVAKQVDGYVAQDLVTIVDKAIHIHALRTAENHAFMSDCVVLDEHDFYTAIKEFTPNCLQGLSLHVENQHDWKDVGGLAFIKESLQRTLTWPLKYPKLFAACALRPQTGILLYGAPGTGKTLLASVVASECGHNFISIKGPELLSKYIGASEQAVRDVFTRAQSAKPCIVFFDEFDSIAPRRGHDSTGVTDRVVNQLLTQLDGVESLVGVSVLAATSRPDLIDPALLRPGRFDKCLHCPLPDQLERLEILGSLSRKLSLDPDVNLKVVAQDTTHFSGADLQALLYSSQLHALNETLTISANSNKQMKDLNQKIKSETILSFPSLRSAKENLTTERKQNLKEQVTLMTASMSNVSLVEEREEKRLKRKSSTYTPVLIRQSDIKVALLGTKPSVSEKERDRFAAIYEKFRLSRGGKLSSHTVSSEKRVTLA